MDLSRNKWERSIHFLMMDVGNRMRYVLRFDYYINAGSDSNMYEGMKAKRCNLIRGTKAKKIIQTVSGLSNQLDVKECYQQMISIT